MMMVMVMIFLFLFLFFCCYWVPELFSTPERALEILFRRKRRKGIVQGVL
jgi:hypothetical protein